MKIIVDRTYGFEVFFVVRRWFHVYRWFNRVFCDARRMVSFAFVDEYFAKEVMKAKGGMTSPARGKGNDV